MDKWAVHGEAGHLARQMVCLVVGVFALLTATGNAAPPGEAPAASRHGRWETDSGRRQAGRKPHASASQIEASPALPLSGLPLEQKPDGVMTPRPTKRAASRQRKYKYPEMPLNAAAVAASQRLASRRGTPCAGRRMFVYWDLMGYAESAYHYCSKACDAVHRRRHCRNLLRNGLGRALGKVPAHLMLPGAPKAPQSRLASPEYSFMPWHATQGWGLDAIFYSRIKGSYDCLTTKWQDADIFYVPAPFAIHLVCQPGLSSSLAVSLELYLRQQPGFQRRQGRDHFMVLGQWDSPVPPLSGPGQEAEVRQRNGGANSGEGQHSGGSGGGSVSLRLAMEGRRPPITMLSADPRTPQKHSHFEILHGREFLQNMTILSAESFPLSGNTWSIPFPTSFHPASKADLAEWARHVIEHPRSTLASLVLKENGQSALETPEATVIAIGCETHPALCQVETCAPQPKSGRNEPAGMCRDPRELMGLYLSSEFCILPAGESYTQGASFEAMLAGCIPVFLADEGFSEQYAWHLPEKRQAFAVSVDIGLVLNGTVDYLAVLQRIPNRRRVVMRKRLMELLPHIVYRDDGKGLKKKRETADTSEFADAYDAALEGLLQHVSQSVSKL